MGGGGRLDTKKEKQNTPPPAGTPHHHHHTPSLCSLSHKKTLSLLHHAPAAPPSPVGPRLPARRRGQGRGLAPAAVALALGGGGSPHHAVQGERVSGRGAAQGGAQGWEGEETGGGKGWLMTKLSSFSLLPPPPPAPLPSTVSPSAKNRPLAIKRTSAAVEGASAARGPAEGEGKGGGRLGERGAPLSLSPHSDPSPPRFYFVLSLTRRPRLHRARPDRTDARGGRDVETHVPPRGAAQPQRYLAPGAAVGGGGAGGGGHWCW